MISVSTYPSSQCENPYIRLYEDALATHGLARGPQFEFSNAYLRENKGRVQALHIQWAAEALWRPWGKPSLWAQARGLLATWRFLRVARSNGIKIVWTVHDIEQHDRRQLADRWGYRLLASMADLVICHDAWAARQFVLQYWGKESRVVVMPHGNYDGAFPPPSKPRDQVLQELGLSPATPTLLCQGTLRPYKGFELAIQAIQSSSLPCQLIIAGKVLDAGWVSHLRSLASGMPNARIIDRLITDQEVVDLANAADAQVLPYHKITGSGAILAAATFGRGVIVSDLPYFTGLLSLEPQAGTVFPVGSVEGLSAAIKHYFMLPPAERGSAARRIADRFPWSQCIQPVASWYKKVFRSLL